MAAANTPTTEPAVYDPRQGTFAFIERESADLRSPRDMAIEIVERILSEHIEGSPTDWEADDMYGSRAPRRPVTMITRHRLHVPPDGIKERRYISPARLPPPTRTTAIKTSVEDLPHTDNGRLDLDEMRRQMTMRHKAKPVHVRQDYSIGRKIVILMAALFAIAAISSGTISDSMTGPPTPPAFIRDMIKNLDRTKNALGGTAEKRVHAPGAPGAPGSQ